VGDEWISQRNEPAAIAGEHESRELERSSQRKEMRELNRQGKIPVTSEAAVGLTQ
jgi:hypothetical protein